MDIIEAIKVIDNAIDREELSYIRFNICPFPHDAVDIRVVNQDEKVIISDLSFDTFKAAIIAIAKGIKQCTPQPE